MYSAFAGRLVVAVNAFSAGVNAVLWGVHGSSLNALMLGISFVITVAFVVEGEDRHGL